MVTVVSTFAVDTGPRPSLPHGLQGRHGRRIVPLPLEVVPALMALQLVAVHERAQQKESQWGVAERWAEHRWRT